jgi:hypothetical protein
LSTIISPAGEVVNTRRTKGDNGMKLSVWIGTIVSVVLQGERRDERGLSQSTENAILVAGAVVVAMALVAAVVAYVNARLPR